MKLFTVSQIREADKYTLLNEPVSSIDLMERAAVVCVNWIINKFSNSHNFIVVCGHGNNGGDGLAIARMLTEKKYAVTVLILNDTNSYSDDFSVNLKRLESLLVPLYCKNIEDLKKELSRAEKYILIDAILGTGTNRPVDGFLKEAIAHINLLNVKKIAVDIPSGLFCDKLNNIADSIIQANYTLTFQFPKISFMYPENTKYTGVFSVLDIGLHIDYIQQTATSMYFTTIDDIRLMIHHRSLAAHKGIFGHAYLIAGSYGKMGAAELASKACLRSGVGLLTAHIPKCGYEIMQTAVPEAMAEADSSVNYISDILKTEKYNAVGVGPGIGMNEETHRMLKFLIQNLTTPIVFDADAINCLAENKTWLAFVRPNAVFTPHVKEFERLVGACSNSEERLQKQKEFSVKNGVVVVLKGAHTAISSPDGSVYFNSTGNPGMATAGSGDVLTGIITSFLAQGYPPLIASIVGVFVHGLAGDFAAEKKSQESMIASDIIDNLSDAFKFINIQS